MAIPYVIVTSCVVIASAAAFHAEAVDDRLASSDPAVMTSSPMFSKVEKSLRPRLAHQLGAETVGWMEEGQQLSALAASGYNRKADRTVASVSAMRSSSRDRWHRWSERIWPTRFLGSGFLAWVSPRSSF